MLVKTSEETFSLVMCHKKSVRGAAEYFNNSATRGEISTWIYMQGSDVILSLKNDAANLHTSVCVRDASKPVKVNSINEIPRRRSGQKDSLLNNLAVVGQRGGY